MISLETTEKFRAESEDEAKEMMEKFRKESAEKGYIIKKSGYEYKTKKAKGEVVDEAWVVSITKVFASIWG